MKYHLVEIGFTNSWVRRFCHNGKIANTHPFDSTYTQEDGQKDFDYLTIENLRKRMWSPLEPIIITFSFFDLTTNECGVIEQKTLNFNNDETICSSVSS